MTLRNRLIASTAIAGFTLLSAVPARAGLLGAGNTVLALYYAGSTALTENENAVTFSGNPSPVSLANPVSYIEGPDDLATILVADTQITITNLTSLFSFCANGSSVGVACTDTIDGFEFKFTGENILGASVNAASAAAFLPVTSGSHVGLDLVNNNDLLIDVTGDNPAVNDQLIIDLSFVAAPPPPPPPPVGAPEPASLALFATAVAGLSTARRRKAKRD